MKFFTRLWDGACAMLHEGGPSSTRFINIIVAMTGAWLLWYTARGNGAMEWPWAFCFVCYLAYGAGPKVLTTWFDTIKAIKGGGNAQATSQAPPPTTEK